MFSSESELVECFLNKKNYFFNSVYPNVYQRIFCLTEFDSSFGVADIVIGTFQKYKRINDKSCINPHWAYPLSSYKLNAKFSNKDFANRTGYSVNYSRQVIQSYIDSGYVIEKNGIYIVVKEYQFILDSVIAVEAKLKNWKQALKQASRYKKFAQLSYVLLDENSIKPALSNIESFFSSNIGLMSLSESGEITIYFSPSLNRSRVSAPLIELNEVAKVSLIS